MPQDLELVSSFQETSMFAEVTEVFYLHTGVLHVRVQWLWPIKILAKLLGCLSKNTVNSPYLIENASIWLQKNLDNIHYTMRYLPLGL